MEINYMHIFSLLLFKGPGTVDSKCSLSLQTCRQCAYLNTFDCLPDLGVGYDEESCANLVNTKSKNGPQASVYNADGSGTCEWYSCGGFIQYIQYSAQRTLTRLTCSTGCRYTSLTMMEDTKVSITELSTYTDFFSEANCITVCIMKASALSASCIVSYNEISQACILYTSCASGGCAFVSGESGWKVFVVTCSNSECHSLQHPDNGVVTTSGIFEGNLATYECNEGFQVVGSITRTCLSDGNWTGNDPSCDPVDCGPLRSVANGVTQVENTTYLSEAVYKCNNGFTPISTIRTCEANGSWSASEPVCLPVYCEETLYLENGVVSINSTSFPITVYFSCNTGYIFYGANESVCLSEGNWSSAVPVCEPVNCGPLVSPAYGSVHVNGTSFFDLAEYRCDDGYKVSGQNRSSVRSCQSDGFWNGTDIECIPVECPVLRNPIYGLVSISGERLYNAVATYICNAGYTLNGNHTRVCLLSGNWSGAEPSCEMPAVSSTVSILGISSTVNVPAIGSTVNVPAIGSTVNVPAIGSTVNVPAIGSTLPWHSKPERIYILPCLCNRNKSFENMTVPQIIDQMVTSMRINNKNTSLSRNKLRSKHDSRKSTKIIGVAGTVIILITCILPILFDVLTFLKLAPK